MCQRLRAHRDLVLQTLQSLQRQREGERDGEKEREGAVFGVCECAFVCGERERGKERTRDA